MNVSAPFVETDETVAIATFTGNLKNGGYVTDSPKTIDLNFTCLSRGKTKVELTIPLDYFKDINLIFEKDCKIGGIV